MTVALGPGTRQIEQVCIQFDEPCGNPTTRLLLLGLMVLRLVVALFFIPETKQV